MKILYSLKTSLFDFRFSFPFLLQSSCSHLPVCQWPDSRPHSVATFLLTEVDVWWHLPRLSQGRLDRLSQNVKPKE